jgi:hypothetical protein
MSHQTQSLTSDAASSAGFQALLSKFYQASLFAVDVTRPGHLAPSQLAEANAAIQTLVRARQDLGLWMRAHDVRPIVSRSPSPQPHATAAAAAAGAGAAAHRTLSPQASPLRAPAQPGAEPTGWLLGDLFQEHEHAPTPAELRGPFSDEQKADHSPATRQSEAAETASEAGDEAAEADDVDGQAETASQASGEAAAQSGDAEEGAGDMSEPEDLQLPPASRSAAAAAAAQAGEPEEVDEEEAPSEPAASQSAAAAAAAQPAAAPAPAAQAAAVRPRSPRTESAPAPAAEPATAPASAAQAVPAASAAAALSPLQQAALSHYEAGVKALAGHVRATSELAHRSVDPVRPTQATIDQYVESFHSLREIARDNGFNHTSLDQSEALFNDFYDLRVREAE